MQTCCRRFAPILQQLCTDAGFSGSALSQVPHELPAMDSASRLLSSTAALRQPSHPGHYGPWRIGASGLSAPMTATMAVGGSYLQHRSFSWGFFRRPPTDVPPVHVPPPDPPLDIQAVESIVQIAGPASMDVNTWEMIHAATWAPNVYLAETLLAITHDYWGLSWALAVPATVVVMRTAMAPLHIIAQKNAHNMAKAAPQMQDAQKVMMAALERGTPLKEAQGKYMEDLKRIQADNKTGFLSMMYPVFVQLPVFTGYYFALSLMCSHHLPSMVLDAAPFGTDLTLPDATHIAPVAVTTTIALSAYLTLSHRWKTLPASQQTVAKYAAVVAPPIMTAAFWSFPSALCYYWTCSNLYTLFFELLLRHPQVRRSVGLPSIAEQIELALDAQKRASLGGAGIMDFYKSSMNAADKEAKADAQNILETTMKSKAVTPGSPAAAMPALKASAAARFAKKRKM